MLVISCNYSEPISMKACMLSCTVLHTRTIHLLSVRELTTHTNQNISRHARTQCSIADTHDTRSYHTQVHAMLCTVYLQ